MNLINYKEFKIPKRTGGFRKIEMPDEEGMKILRDRLKYLEENYPILKPSVFTHSFANGRNIVTCARQHEGKKYIARIDIKDFFNSITYKRFVGMAYQRIADEQERGDFLDKIKICFRPVKAGEAYDWENAYLPQGSPTSPFLSNAYMYLFDWKMAWFCYERGIIYNRYADDVFLSSDVKDTNLFLCMNVCSNFMNLFDLKENRKKRKLMKNGIRMSVAGIVLNEKFNIPRKKRRIIRAIKHNTINKPQTMHQKGLISFERMVKEYDKRMKTNLEICREIEIRKDL